MTPQHLNRTAQGHVEIILSFVLFIAFLLAALAIFNLANTNYKRTSLDHEQEVILNNISKNYGKLSIFVKTVENCYDDKKNIIEAQFGDSTVRQKYGASFIEAYSTSINNPQQSRIYTLYFGDFFDPSRYGVVSCVRPTNGRNYILGGYTKDQVIVKQKLKDFKINYETNYATLATTLGIDNFAFSVRTIDGIVQTDFSVSPNKKISPTLKIVSIDFPIIVMDDQGNKQEYIMNIQKW